MKKKNLQLSVFGMLSLVVVGGGFAPKAGSTQPVIVANPEIIGTEPVEIIENGKELLAKRLAAPDYIKIETMEDVPDVTDSDAKRPGFIVAAKNYEKAMTLNSKNGGIASVDIIRNIKLSIVGGKTVETGITVEKPDEIQMYTSWFNNSGKYDLYHDNSNKLYVMKDNSLSFEPHAITWFNFEITKVRGNPTTGKKSDFDIQTKMNFGTEAKPLYLSYDNANGVFCLKETFDNSISLYKKVI